MHTHKRIGTIAALPLIALLLAGCSATADAANTSGSPTSVAVDQPAEAVAKTTSWYAKKYPTFTKKTFTGTGDDVITLPKGASAGVLKAKHTGEANFILSILDGKNQQTPEMGVNAIGDYKGTVAYGLMPFGKPAKTITVKADGKWSITVSDFDSARELPASGKGDGVFKYDGKARTAKIVHRGDANFIVLEYSDALMSNLQINEIGNYSGTSLVDAGPAIVSVQADGRWSIK